MSRPSPILDRNGVPIAVGMPAVVLSKDSLNFGKIGTVRDLRNSGTRSVRIAKGPLDRPEWSSWCAPEDVAVGDPSPAPVPPRQSATG